MQRNLNEWFHKSDSSEKLPTLIQSSSANQEPGPSENSVEPPKKKHLQTISELLVVRIFMA
jgi:hypothetical protein